MAGSVRNKIRWGTLFLFALVLLLGSVSIYFLLKTKNEAKSILTANYESIDYCHQMQNRLDSFLLMKNLSVSRFHQLLQLQADNITEQGEAAETAQLQKAFAALSQGDTSNKTTFLIRQHLNNIINLNMQAIQRKSVQAEKNATDATTLITVISTIAIIIALSFAFTFPDVLIKPINKLVAAIQEISKKNYQYRIHLDNNHDEFGQLANSFNEMAERLEYFESSNLNKIIFEKSRAEAVINSLKDASIGVDKNDTVLFANNQALQLLGLQAKDIVGVQTSEVSKRNDLFKYLLEEKGSTPFKIVVDNRENYFTKEVIEINQEGSNNRVIVLKNITSFKELDVAKNNFIATISHELKTPLASSDFSLKLLEDERIGKLDAEQKELVKQLKNDNQRMLKILSELLNLSQVEAGKIQLHVAPANLAEIIQSSIQAVATSSKEKGIEIKQEGEAPPSVLMDADKVSWVINNFLTNAITFSPQGGSVTIQTVQKENTISIFVQDQGPGIEEKYHSQIFERFYQIPGRSFKKGSGIGLAICKELVTAMGGNVWVKSTFGEGSTFGFDLPLLS